MRRKMEEMKNIVEKIEMRSDVQEEMLANLNAYADEIASQPVQTHKNKTTKIRNYASLKKAAVIVGTICMIGLASVPVKAFVQSLLQERMEEIPEEELETIFEEKQEQEVETDGFSRAFREEENERMTALALEYRMGRFPEKEILQVETQEQVKNDTLCYVTENSFYSLPERDLTDEEILQYLDFQEKINYALEKEQEKTQEAENEFTITPEEADRIEQEGIEKVKAAGGIDEKKANEIGAYWLSVLFGKETMGLENNCYLFTTDEEIKAEKAEFVMAAPSIETIKYRTLYLSYYGVIHDNYYFYVDGKNGKLASMQHTYPRTEDAKISQSRMEELLKSNMQEAKRILKESFEMQEEIVHIYGSYIMNGDKVIENGIASFHFVTEDGDDYILSMNVQEQKLVGYVDTYYEAYMEQQKLQEEGVKEFLGEEKYSERERITKEMK